MEGKRFLNILKKQKYTLMAIPVLVMVIAFILTRKLPNVYSSKGSLAAGIVKASAQMSILDANPLQESKVSQEFGNMIQLMQMKKVYDQVSYKLILHDLEGEDPFRKASKLMGELNENARKHAITVYKDLYSKRQPLSLWDQDQKGLNDLIISMGYDYESLSKKMRVYRIDNSDFITAEFESESPVLSAFAVNTLFSEFIAYHTSINHESEERTIKFLGDLLNEKRNALDTSMGSLKRFKIDNRLLNLTDQGKSLYAQITEFENKIQEVQKTIDANTGALENLNDKFTSEEQRNIDKVLSSMNQSVISLTEQINIAQDEYTKSGFESKYLKKIDSLVNAKKLVLTQASNRYTANPNATKDNLVSQRISLEVNRDMAQSGIKSLQKELRRLNNRFDTLVPKEATINTYEGNISVASQEYVEMQKKYNQATMAFNSSAQIKQIEMAMPGNKLPSKKMLLVLVSGIGSLVVCLLVIFLLFYLDNSLKYVDELSNKTNLPVLGTLPYIVHSSLLNLNELWAPDNDSVIDQEFRNQLRSVRFETENCMEGNHMLTVTSLGEGEGKTFLAMCLASAYTMVNKKVLLIDGNFTNNTISTLTDPAYYIEDFLTGRTNIPYPGEETDITIIGNKGQDISLFEINTEAIIRQKIQQLKDAFDIIIVESSSLNTMNQAKEWIAVTDKVIASFEANKVINGEKKIFVGYLKSLNNKYIGWVMNRLTEDEDAPKPKRRFFRKKADQ